VSWKSNGGPKTKEEIGMHCTSSTTTKVYEEKNGGARGANVVAEWQQGVKKAAVRFYSTERLRL
jgi:hypothetical protein